MNILGAILPWLQVIVAVLLITTVLLQSSREGLGSAFGGGDAGGASYAKRGLEKKLFIATIVLAATFLTINLLALFL